MKRPIVRAHTASQRAKVSHRLPRIVLPALPGDEPLERWAENELNTLPHEFFHYLTTIRLKFSLML
jgi:hypothetical protein